MNSKVIVTTGASRGLGKMLSKGLVDKGAKVIISGDHGEELEATAGEIGARAIIADVTKLENVRTLADQVVSEFGKIDIWINNAGIWLPRAVVEDADLEQSKKVFDVNFFGTLNGCRAVLPHMKKEKGGTILNVISASALGPRPNSAIYAASKWAERGFTDSLREEVRSFGIKVVGVYPGGIKTELFHDSKPAEYDNYMDPADVAQKIIENLTRESPEEEQIITNQ